MIKVSSKNSRVSASNVSKKYEKQFQQIIAMGANSIRNTAVQSIQESGSQGRTYGRHIASTAGNPPNTDTGFLANNIHVQFDLDKLGCDIESRADYSVYLEFGTSTMGARPFLQPAVEENRDKIMRDYSNIKLGKV